MIALDSKDLFWILRRTPRCVINLMESHRLVFMAGGFIRACIANEEVQDLDLFAPDAERADLYARAVAGGAGTIYKTQNAITIRRPDVPFPIQVVHRWTYVTAEELIESFDFTIAKAVVWCTTLRDNTNHKPGWTSIAHDNFYIDLAAKRLTYTSPKRNEDAGGSALRMLKFYQRGYRIPLDSMGAVLARLYGGVHLDQLPQDRPREEALAMVITGLLHEVDPLLDPHHIFHLPSGQGEENEAV